MVSLVGAGPGDAMLMSKKGEQRILNADVVLYDRLVGDDIIKMIPRSAEKINVGKCAGRHLLPQHEINALILQKAKEGLNVVRLKGGDPFVFGRGGEELELLAANNIEFEVVPGISSSTSGGAYAGIPITHRDYASSFHIITGHAKKDGKLDINYEPLVKLNGTLVFMMSVSTLNEICTGLILAGIDKDMPAAIIENATTYMQRKFIGTVSTLYSISKENAVKSPSLIIIGKVCALSNTLDWFSNRPLIGKTVLVTRARGGASDLSFKLKDLGCRVIESPCIKTAPLIKDNKSLDEAIKNVDSFKWLIFTSAVGVSLFFEYLTLTKTDIRKLHHLKIAVVGPETKKAVEKYGVYTDYMPETYNGVCLANGLLPWLTNGEKVLIARAKSGAPEIAEIFTNNGVQFLELHIYDTLYETPEDNNVNEMLLNGHIDIVTFTSSSTVKGFVNAFSGIDFNKITGVCIGEKTRETAESYGINTVVSEKATISGVIDKIKEML